METTYNGIRDWQTVAVSSLTVMPTTSYYSTREDAIAAAKSMLAADMYDRITVYQPDWVRGMAPAWAGERRDMVRAQALIDARQVIQDCQGQMTETHDEDDVELPAYRMMTAARRSLAVQLAAVLGVGYADVALADLQLAMWHLDHDDGWLQRPQYRMVYGDARPVGDRIEVAAA